jgi:hypothetical protein
MLESYTFESGGRTTSFPSIEFRGHETVFFPIDLDKKGGMFSIPKQKFDEASGGRMFQNLNQLAGPASWGEPLSTQTTYIEVLAALRNAFLTTVNKRVQEKAGYVGTRIFTAEVMSFEKFGIQHHIFIVRSTNKGNRGTAGTREAVATRQDGCRREFPQNSSLSGNRNGYYLIDNEDAEAVGEQKVDQDYCRIFGIQLIPTPSATDPKKTELKPHRII